MNGIRNTAQQTHPLSKRVMLALIGLALVTGCAGRPVTPPKTIYQSGLSEVRVEQDPDSTANAHPAAVTATEVGTLLRGVRAWERRNVIHRLFVGEADRTRAFRNEEITVLAPPLAKGLAQAGPAERVYFHLSQATDQGDEETTTGWISIRGPILHLTISGVHDRHSPGPDISKYDRQLPNIPEASAAHDVTFEPEEFLVKVSSGSRLFAPDQREELQIRYREALSSMPVQPGLERGSEKHSQP